MISVRAAQKIILRFARPLGRETVPLSESLGSILAEDVYAPISLPVADNSAMDGFTVRSKDTRQAKELKPVRLFIRGTIRAGDDQRRKLKLNETYRIMTGAFIPKGADSVIPKEEVRIEGNCLAIKRPVVRGAHIRYEGEEIKRGQLVLRKDAVIHPATVGMLASLGRTTVRIFKRPRISIVVTGHELVRPGTSLKAGQIYDSNSFMLSSCLKQMDIFPLRIDRIGDRPRLLRKVMDGAIKRNDVVILTGGVSVGEYDYVKDILKSCGAETLFWKVRQKPGKPLYFGKKGRTLVFGLPGNPASAFVCFYEYVFPAIRQMSGFSSPSLARKKAILEKTIERDNRKVLFLKARMHSNGFERIVRPLGFQGSHMISSLQEANCLILVPPGREKMKKGEQASVDCLSGNGEGGL